MNYNINKSNNQVPKGYKKTKVGVVPEDWKVVKISELGSLTGGGTPNTKNKESWNGTIPWISSSDLTENSIYNIKISRYITEDSIQNSATKLVPKNSILIVSRVGVGKVAINKNDICTSQDFQNLTLKNDSTIFIAYLIKDKTKILISYNQGTSIKGFVKSDLKNLKIPLPPLKEQQKIANILTTWDDAISKQEELIKAKEELKKGLMQKLLSGEVRFEGFINEWVETKLSNYIVEISKKNKDKKISLVLTVSTKHGFISQEDYFDREIASKDTSNYKIVKKGDFAYNPSRINIGSISYLDTFEEGILSPMYVIFKCNDNLNSSYFTYWLNTHSFKGNLYKYLSGSVRDSLSFRDMKLMKIRLPLLQEQQKIAEVLANADKEINLLKNELEELKEQKKGLMQKLLTGEVRVKT